MLLLPGWYRVFLAFQLLASVGRAAASAAQEAENSEGRAWSPGLEQFFGSIDNNGDGQIEPAEALRYINANFDSHDIQQDPSEAAQHMSKNLDGSDSDATISKAEVESHLRKLLKGNRVTEWLKHSAQMPQYVQAFRDNSITSLDFPMLVADGGSTLELDLGVKSKLHREQLMRAIKRVILGIGTVPSSPEDLQCVPLACDAVALRWRPPGNPGSPPAHRYKLERQCVKLPGDRVVGHAWETANGELDDEDLTWVDAGLEVGEYQYRMTAWNALGWSEYMFATGCSTVNASLPCPPEKCWTKEGCRQAESKFASAAATGDASVVWKLLCSFGGMAVVSLLVSSRFLSGRQQAGALQRCASLIGLGHLVPSKDPSGGGAETGSEECAPSPASLSPSPSRQELPTEALLRRGWPGQEGAPPLRQLTHNESINSRLSGRDGASSSGSPRRRSQIQAARGETFLPHEVDTFRGDTFRGAVDPGLGPQLPNLRTTSRGHAGNGLPGESEVLWLDDEGVETNPPAALDIPASPQQTGRHACGFPACDKSLHPIFNPRAAMTSHYCSICQNVFCHRHTAYSPHGRLGSCGMESKCICQICYDDLPRGTQDRLEKSNKLQRSKGNLASLTKEKSRKTNLFGSARHSNHQLAPGNLPGRGSPPDSRGPTREESFNERSPYEHSAARNWGRLRTAWTAAMQFRGAGREYRRKSLSGSRGRSLSQEMAGRS